MELVNQTPAVADVVVTLGEDEGPRVGLLTAKVTFTIDPHGRTAIDTQNPHPLYATEENTELGLLPSDAVQRRDPVFEVVLVGAAHAPGGRPTERMTVGLSVGDITRIMSVTGDRFWKTGFGQPTISRPIPFVRMPLTFERAFGGACDVHLDMDTVVQVRDPLNQHGRGFDAEGQARLLAEYLESPQGFPFIEGYVRMVPNLEHPEHRVARWEDVHDPYCWSTVPRDIAFAHIQDVKTLQMKAAVQRDPTSPEEIDDLALARLHHRAHPDWIVELPPPKTRVAMTGVTPSGKLAFEMPQVRIVADYIVGDRRGSRDLAPQSMVLLPDEHRMYLVYRTAFTVETEPEMERSFRLRLEPGWFQYPQQARA